MLQNIHDKAKGWVAYLIVGFIAVPFALFGISSYLGGSNSLVAATVNGEDIPVTQVQNIVLQQRQRLSQMFGGKIPPSFNEDTIKKQALEQVISQTLLRQEAKENGYRASNQEIYDYISEIPAFQNNGQFDAAAYEALLGSQRRSKAGFETEVRDSISNQQFSQTISDTAFIPAAELKRYQALQNQTRNIETYTLKGADYKSQVNVADDEVKTYYDKNTANYMTAEKVKLAYVLLNQAEIAKSIPVENDALQLYFDENADRYREPEQRKLSHILVKVASDDEVAKTKAKEKIQALYDQIEAGSKSFEDIASTDSGDSLAAEKKGEIGFIERGEMGPLFEKPAFALLKAGDISKPVKTEAGYEIIKLLEIVAAKQKNLDDVKAEVEKQYQNEQAEKLFLDQSDKLQTLAFENDGSLEEAADAVAVKLKTSGWIDRSSGGKAADAKDALSSPKIITAAFSDDVLNNGKNSELIEIDSSTVAVVRLEEHQLPQQKPLTDVTSSIKETLNDQKLRTLLIEKGELALAAIQQSGQWLSLDSIGATAGKVESKESVKRTGSKLSPAVVEKLFSMQKPGQGKKSFGNAILANGDYVLISVSTVKVDGTKAASDIVKNSFTSALASREQAAVLKSLREQAEVQLFPENIQ